MSARRAARHRSSATVAGAFTLVEMLVASVIVSVALVGIHQVFFQAMDLQSGVWRRWQDRNRAQAAADEMAETLESLATVRDVEPLVTSPAGDGFEQLICQTATARVRYTWSPDRDGLIDLFRQRKPTAGSRDLTVAPGEDDPEAPESWSQVPRQRLATALAAIQVDRRVERRSRRVVVQIDVVCGDQRCTRLVSPPVPMGDASNEEGQDD